MSGEASSASGDSSDASGSSSSPSSPPTTHSKTSVSPVPASVGGKQPPQQQQQQQPKKASNGVDVMELLESAGRSYLGGQCFSDDADSHDETSHHSPPERAATAPQQQKVGMAFKIGGSSETSLSHPSPVSSGGGGGGGVGSGNSRTPSGRVSLPAQIPLQALGGVAQNSVATPPQQLQGGVAQSSPQKAAMLVSQSSSHSDSSQLKIQTRSPVFSKAGANLSPQGPSTSPRGGGRHRGGFQHAASFDQARAGSQWAGSGGATGGVETGHGSRSNSLFRLGTSPYSTTTPPSRHFYSAQVPSRAYSAAAVTSSHADSSIVKKLFDSKSEPANMSATTSSFSLQTLFSQAAAASAPTTPPTSGIQLSSSMGSLQGLPSQHRHPPHHQHPPPLHSALSVDEIEKRLTAEAPPSSNGAGTQVIARSSTSPVKSVGKGSFASSSGHTVLLQPSAFATPPAPPVQQTQATLISVEPPSPLPAVAEVGPRPQMFPPIPPLMHSAGMTAPPLAEKPGATAEKNRSPASPGQSRRSSPPKGGGVATGKKETEPGGGGITIATTTRELHTPPAATAITTTTTTPIVKGTSVAGEFPIPGRSFTVPSTLMSPQQFSSSSSSSSSHPPPRDESKSRLKGTPDIGLTREQMQEALLYLIQVSDFSRFQVPTFQLST